MKKLLVILLLFFVLGCEQKRPLPECEGTDHSKWTNCFGAITHANGDKYVGEWKDGKKNGQGTFTWASGKFAGDKYVGEFKDDKRHGQGTYTWADGTIYVGEWKDGKQEGQGTYTLIDGRKYVGDWKGNKRHGQGTYTDADGDKYVGEYKDDKQHGQGTDTWASGKFAGDKYVGEFKDDKRHGQGTYTKANGEKIVGEWKDGEPVKSKVEISKGKDLTGSSLPKCKGADDSKWTNCFNTLDDQGHKYAGEWKDGKYHGQGTLVLTSGDKYVGEFKDGRFYGQGTLTFADGGKRVGEWKNGVPDGQGTETFADGDKYVGESRNAEFHGQGTYTYRDGSIYVGKWKDGKREGQGTFTFADGSKYVGEFKDGKKHGQGTFARANGDKYVGEYKDGNFHGQGAYTKANGEKTVGEWKDGIPVKSKVEISKGKDVIEDFKYLKDKSPDEILREVWKENDKEELFKKGEYIFTNLIQPYNADEAIEELYKASSYFNKIVYAGSSDDLFDEESPTMKSYKYLGLMYKKLEAHFISEYPDYAIYKKEKSEKWKDSEEYGKIIRDKSAMGIFLLGNKTMLKNTADKFWTYDDWLTLLVLESSLRNLYASMMLPIIYFLGLEDFPLHSRDIIDFYRSEASLGNLRAGHYIGIALATGAGIERDMEKALPFLCSGLHFLKDDRIAKKLTDDQFRINIKKECIKKS